MRRSLCGFIGFLLLTSCGGVPVSTDPLVDESAASSIAAPVTEMTYQGTIQKLGVSIYMEGTHRLFTEETSIPLLLESSFIRLDDYVDRTVRVMGPVQATVEGNAMIMNVQAIEGSANSADVSVLEEESQSSMSSEASSSSEHIVSSSSSAAPPPPALSPASSKASSAAPPPPPPVSSSSSEAASSSVSSVIDHAGQTKAMAKASATASGFSESYCTGHIGFCVPYHKSWYYKSFGGNVSPWLWHVEFANAAIENEGDGVIVLNLVSGSLPAGEQEGVAFPQGDGVLAKLQWTGNRHFTVGGPAELKTAIEHMAQSIIVYQQQ